MAQFCTKCGTQLQEGMIFCTGCGASVGPPPPAPAAPAPMAQPPMAPMAPPPAAPMAPMAQPPMAPVAAAPALPAAAPKRSSGSPVLKIVLIVLAVILVLGLLAAGSCVFFLYRVKQKATQLEKQAQMTFPMPAGTREVRTQPLAPAATPTPPAGPVVDTGVAVYPGATPFGGGGQMTMGSVSMKSQVYTTSDSVDQVLAFYKDKLGSAAVVTQSNGKAALVLNGTNGQTTVEIEPDSSSGKTKISISNVTK